MKPCGSNSCFQTFWRKIWNIPIEWYVLPCVHPVPKKSIFLIGTLISLQKDLKARADEQRKLKGNLRDRKIQSARVKQKNEEFECRMKSLSAAHQHNDYMVCFHLSNDEPEFSFYPSLEMFIRRSFWRICLKKVWMCWRRGYSSQTRARGYEKRTNWISTEKTWMH